MTRKRIAATTLAIAVLVTLGAHAGPVEDLAGYWSGSGSVVLSNGKTERVKCSVSYKAGEAAGQIKQNMRCASADYNINASASFNVKGQTVTGSWEEKTYSAVGEVTGRVNGGNYTLAIKGVNFSASMNVTLTDCKQQISIVPQGLDVSRISIGLAKC